jgi:glycosyltransferase involved in cell wall biosynthesis
VSDLCTNMSIRNQKTILFVTRSPEYGGTEKHLLDLIRQLSGRKVKLSILCLDADSYTERLKQYHTSYIDVSCERNVDSVWKWFCILRDARADVVVFVRSWVWCFPWYTCVVAWLAGITRRFSIVHLPPLALSRTARRFRRLQKRVSGRRLALCCTSTICVSDAIRDSLMNEYHFPGHKSVTIHNGVSLSGCDQRGRAGLAVRTRLGVTSDEFLFVCVARLTTQKRIDILLSALARALGDGVQCKCVIVGDGPLKAQLLQQAAALGLSGNVVFEGFQEDVQPYLNASDAFALTSDTEGFPLSILEAMACGLPCVVTNVGGNAEAIADGIHGFVVPPGSVEKVAEAISYLVRNPDQCAQMSRAARTRVCESFDIDEKMAEVQRLILS